MIGGLKHTACAVLGLARDWMAWRLAGRDLAELQRWRVRSTEARQWLAEFTPAAEAIDHLVAEAAGQPCEHVSKLRDRMRATQRPQPTVPRIRRGQAIVIAGKQGTGKSQLARFLAADAGGLFTEVDAAWFVSGRDFRRHVGTLRQAGDKPHTIIFDGMPGPSVMNEIKQLITTDRLPLRGRGGKVSLVPSPNFVFCTGSVRALDPDTDGRRFHVIQLEGGAA